LVMTPSRSAEAEPIFAYAQGPLWCFSVTV